MPPSFEIPLAELLDRLSAAEPISIVEAQDLRVNGLTADQAKEICALVDGAWPIAIEDSADGPTTPAQLDAAFEPFRMLLQKPAAEQGRLQLVTLAGLRQALLRPDLPPTVELASCKTAFETKAFRLVGWGDQPAGIADEETRSPRDLVRETAQARVVPSDIRRWLLVSEQPAQPDPAFSAWGELAAVNLARSLVSDVVPDGGLVLRGIIRLRIDAPDGTTFAALGTSGFAALQQAGHWVYQNSREAETRLGLLINELTRSTHQQVSAAECFRACAEALEGAKLAFQLGLEGLSKDSMKALSDLRKSLSDETAKLSDITRQLALAVAGSIFLGMGVIFTKQSSNISGMGIFFFALVLAIYVACVGLSGHQFIILQRDLRDEWRKILYRFISDAEYLRMVTTPAQKAERNFYDACLAGGLALGVLFTAMAFMFR